MSNLRILLDRYREHPAVQKIVSALGQTTSGGLRLQLDGLIGAQESFVLAATARQLQAAQPPAAGFHLFVANSKEEAAYRQNDLAGLLGDEQVLFFPDSFKRPAYFDDLNQTQILQRSETINKMTATPATDGTASARSMVIVSYPEALFEKVVKPEVLTQHRIDLQIGEQIDLDFVIQVLVEYGFERADFVYEPGQFSIRGGIIDLFSYGNDLPYRVELFDAEVESIRIFDPLTQLSKQRVSRVGIVPNLNTRFRQDQKVSLLQVLPPDTVLWIKDFQFLLDRLQYCFERAESFASKINALDVAELRELFRDRAFLYPSDVAEDVLNRPMVFLEKQSKDVGPLLQNA
jgi:transcription-repair coupling factor (superfamily II helicase)